VPCRGRRVDHRRHLPDATGIGARGPDRGHLRDPADADPRQVLLGEPGQHFELAALGDAEQRRAAWAHDLPRLDRAGQHQPGGRRTHVETADRGALLGELGTRHCYAGVGGIAGRGLAVEIGARHEPAADQRRGPIELGLRDRGIGARDLDRRIQLRRLLPLHRPVDRRERLPGRDPLARVDQHALDSAALARNADRHIAPGRDRAGRGHHRRHRTASRDHHRHPRCGGGRSGSGRIGGRRGLVAAARHEERDRERCDQQRAADDHPQTPRPRASSRRRVAGSGRSSAMLDWMFIGFTTPFSAWPGDRPGAVLHDYSTALKARCTCPFNLSPPCDEFTAFATLHGGSAPRC
jgi:hypothetical protein